MISQSTMGASKPGSGGAGGVTPNVRLAHYHIGMVGGLNEIKHVKDLVGTK